ncbi:MAG: hypothetical protein AAGJ86_03125, partial [Pseudomonadota bacterium]
MSLVAELKRRNVFRVSAAYIVGAWAVAQVADLAFDSFNAPDWAMQAVLIILLLGLPITAAAAWALELGPDGLQRDDDGKADPKFQARTRRRLNQVIIGFLVVGAGVLTYTLLRQPEISPDEAQISTLESAALSAGAVSVEPSIAVLPFIDMSPAQDQRHIADGVATELMTALHRVDNLRVVSRTSAFAFRDSDLGLKDIANALNVDHIVEGSVSRDGNRIRIEAALVDIRTDERLWSDSYTQELSDAFALQAGITRKIAAALSVVVGDEANADIETVFEATANPEAYEEFLIGTTLWARRGEDNIRNGIGHLEQALELEPNFARAEAALAIAYITFPTYARVNSAEQWQTLSQTSWQQATIHAQNAIALDPSLVAAYSALGDLARLNDRWDDARRFYLKGLSLDPDDATLNIWYAEYLQDIGLTQQTLEQDQRSLELDPLSAAANASAAGGHIIAGNCDKVAEYARTAAALGHDFGEIAPVFCAIQESRWSDALAGLRELELGDNPDEQRFEMLVAEFAEAKDDESRERAREALTAFVLTWGDSPDMFL